MKITTPDATPTSPTAAAPAPVVPAFVFQPRKPIRYKARAVAATAPPVPPPPTPANVVATAYGSAGIGGWVTLTFDQPVTLASSPTPDYSILFAGTPPTAVSADDAHTLRFETSLSMYAGAVWNIYIQPSYVSSPVAVPQGGSF